MQKSGSAGLTEVTIPYRPRPLQLEYHRNRTRFSAVVCHRRFGKTMMQVNELLRSALMIERVNMDIAPPRYAYIGPTYKQAKRIAWPYMRALTQPIPGVYANESELFVRLPNGATIFVLGADDPDSLRGSYLDGCVLDEYQLFAPSVFGLVVRPQLADYGGWASFSGTPMGLRNPLREIWDMAERDGWYHRIHRASDTGYVDAAELADARQQMSPEQYAQEFECDWSGAIVGAVYAERLREAEQQGRLDSAAWDDSLPVHTAWDLGMDDSTAIWFYQAAGGQWRWLDYYEGRGEGLSHYANVVLGKMRERGWTKGTDNVPHDAKVRELGTGKSRVEIMTSLGLSPMVVKKLDVADGIEAARNVIRRSWFDAKACKHGLDALWNYRREYDDDRRILMSRPVHDWSSHAADAFRCAATAETTTGGVKFPKLNYPKRSGIV
jgi:phage terminase large subunit